MRTLGLTRPGQPLHGLPDDFALTDGDLPDDPEDEEAGRDQIRLAGTLPGDPLVATSRHAEQDQTTR